MGHLRSQQRAEGTNPKRLRVDCKSTANRPRFDPTPTQHQTQVCQPPNRPQTQRPQATRVGPQLDPATSNPAQIEPQVDPIPVRPRLRSSAGASERSQGADPRASSSQHVASGGASTTDMCGPSETSGLGWKAKRTSVRGSALCSSGAAQPARGSALPVIRGGSPPTWKWSSAGSCEEHCPSGDGAARTFARWVSAKLSTSVTSWQCWTILRLTSTKSRLVASANIADGICRVLTGGSTKFGRG